MSTAVRAAEAPRRHPGRWGVAAVIAGPAIFTTAWLVLGAVSPGYTLWDLHVADYSPMSQPISGLGLGVTAPYMNLAFVVMGVLLMAGPWPLLRAVPGLTTEQRRTYASLLGISGLGGLLDGLFTLESILLHGVGFLLALSPVVTFPVVGRGLRRLPGWERFGSALVLAGPVTLVLAVVYLVSFDPAAAGRGEGIAGFTQRLLVLHMHAWFVALAWRVRRGTARSERGAAAA